MATLPDMYLDRDGWTFLTESDSWTIQCVEGYAYIAWSDDAPPADQFCGVRIYEHRRLTGKGRVYGRAGRLLGETRITVNEGVQTSETSDDETTIDVNAGAGI